MPLETTIDRDAPPGDKEALAGLMPDPDGRESQLLGLARTLFARKGYEATSLRDIAEAANVSKTALYHYFPNKEALYEQVVIDSMNALLAKVRAAVERAPSPTAKIRAFLHASAHELDNARDRWLAGSNAFWQSGATAGRGAALRQRDAYEHLLRDCIEGGIANGELRAVDAAMACRLLLSGLNHMPRWHRTGGRLQAQEVMDQYLDIVLLGMLNRAEPARAAPVRRA